MILALGWMIVILSFFFWPLEFILFFIMTYFSDQAFKYQKHKKKSLIIFLISL